MKMRVKMLSSDEYVTLGGACPECESTDFGTWPTHITKAGLIKPCNCPKCDAEWEEVYVLTRYANLRRKRK